jgi:hypothetical protein
MLLTMTTCSTQQQKNFFFFCVVFLDLLLFNTHTQWDFLIEIDSELYNNETQIATMHNLRNFMLYLNCACCCRSFFFQQNNNNKKYINFDT